MRTRSIHSGARGRAPARLALAFGLAAAPPLCAAGTVSPSGAAAAGTESFLATFGELLVDGGVLMVPIGLASVLTLGLAIERWWALRRTRVLPRDLWRDVQVELGGGNVRAARDRVAGKGSALARMLDAGLARWDGDRVELVRTLEEAGQREADDLLVHLNALQGIASVAPLLGLLGTVVGMIQAFYTIAKERMMGNPELFAGPIGMALITTAAGLTVAIPAVVLYYWFRGRVRGLVRGLDDAAREVIEHRRRVEARG